VPRFEPGPFHSVRAADLATLFRRTAFAADDDLSSRYFLDGVLVEPDRAHAALVGVATDGRRIARQIIPAVLGEAPDVARRTLLPSKAVRLFGRLLGPEDDLNVHLRLGERAALLRTDTAEASARLVEGRFPRYQDVFPDRCVHRATTTVEDLKEAIGAALVTTALETRGIDFVLAERGCVLRSAAADRGKGEVALTLGYEGPDLTITLDGEFLLQCLKILPATQAITLEVPADGRTLVLTGADRYHYLQCPIVNAE
jgi:DNA polymerase III subunit beta